MINIDNNENVKYIGYIKVLQLLEKEIDKCIGYDDLIELTKLYCEVYKTFRGGNNENNWFIGKNSKWWRCTK